MCVHSKLYLVNFHVMQRHCTYYFRGRYTPHIFLHNIFGIIVSHDFSWKPEHTHTHIQKLSSRSPPTDTHTTCMFKINAFSTLYVLEQQKKHINKKWTPKSIWCMKIIAREQRLFAMYCCKWFWHLIAQQHIFLCVCNVCCGVMRKLMEKYPQRSRGRSDDCHWRNNILNIV